MHQQPPHCGYHWLKLLLACSIIRHPKISNYIYPQASLGRPKYYSRNIYKYMLSSDCLFTFHFRRLTPYYSKYTLTTFSWLMLIYDPRLNPTIHSHTTTVNPVLAQSILPFEPLASATSPSCHPFPTSHNKILLLHLNPHALRCKHHSPPSSSSSDF